MTGYLFFTFLTDAFCYCINSIHYIPDDQRTGHGFPPASPKWRHRNHHGPRSLLAVWMSRQREVPGRHLQGKSTQLTNNQAMRLLALGSQGGGGGATCCAGIRGSVGVTGKSVASRDFDVRWRNMLLRLSNYKVSLLCVV